MVGRGSESKSMGKSRKAPQKILLYQKHRKKQESRSGNESTSMGKRRIEITGHGIKTMGTWKAKMQEMSWEAEATRSKCREPGSKEPCKIYEL